MTASDRRLLGRTGLEVSALCIGTSSWGPLRAGESETARDARVDTMARRAFDGGFGTNVVDTSNIYGDGLSEVYLGRALAALGGLPQGVVLQTKLDRDLATGSFSAERMRRSAAESLERLGLDSVHVLYLHDPESIGFEAAMAPGGPVEALVALRDEGVAAHIGISGGPVDMMQRFVETDVFDALVTHNRYTLVDRSAAAMLDAAAERGVGVCNAAPYGAGVLTGDPRFADGYGYRPIRPGVRTAVERMSALCAEAGVPLAAAALQFSLRSPRVHTTVVGGSDAKRLDEAVALAAVSIPDGLWAELDAVAPAPADALDAPLS
ncbi:MAG TPA: aldo/keto reductase [Gryllotalpicola sp.]